MKMYSINAGYFKLDGGAMFGVVPKSMWSKINEPDENNMCSWAMRCLLIEDEGKLILVDNGMGNKQDAKFFGHYYLHGNDTLEKSLASNGFSVDDITDVFLTHLHFDHCGGSIVKVGDVYEPAFKNAKFWSNKLHWDWALNPNAREKASFLKENILPIADTGRLHFIDIAENDISQTFDTPLTNNFGVKVCSGHTKAMMLPVLKYNGNTMVYMADLLPSAGHMPLPYVMGYDMFPLVTLTEKKQFLDEAVENNYILFFEHDKQYECCTLQQTDKGVRPLSFFNLSDL
jgi:glyoxylase-like metal-dependent hydrolase (beta-lactamase superfamily II)